jgi:GGDEF domain-containing protein
MQSAILLLTESLAKISEESAGSARNLERIAGEIESLPEAGDLAESAGRVGNCLAVIRDEAARLKKQYSGIRGDLDRLQGQVENTGKPPSEIDSVTGLGGQDEGTKAVRAACASGGSSHAVVFAADRMEALNLRFGFAAGDQILLLLAQHIAQSLQPGDLMFRWRGPCFLLLLKRSTSDARVQAEMTGILASRLKHTLNMGTREVVVQVTGSWTILSLTADTDMKDVMRRVDEFAVLRSRTTG